MSDDLTHDPEWLALLADLGNSFWNSRVPAFRAVWQACQDRAGTAWGDDLKRSVHGLAGVAAMIGHPGIGDLARRIEQRWDEQGVADAVVADLLHDLAAALQQAEPGR